jgi:hypothetical protein
MSADEAAAQAFFTALGDTVLTTDAVRATEMALSYCDGIFTRLRVILSRYEQLRSLPHGFFGMTTQEEFQKRWRKWKKTHNSVPAPKGSLSEVVWLK